VIGDAPGRAYKIVVGERGALPSGSSHQVVLVTRGRGGGTILSAEHVSDVGKRGLLPSSMRPYKVCALRTPNPQPLNPDLYPVSIICFECGGELRHDHNRGYRRHLHAAFCARIKFVSR
jgi:hypothetical protein